MAEIRSYTMNFSSGITSTAPRLACAEMHRVQAFFDVGTFFVRRGA